MGDVLAHSSHLTGSEGSEYDLVIAEGEQLSLPNQQEKLAAKLGFHPRLMGVDTADLFSVEDLIPAVPADETSKQAKGLSRREMNRAKRKVLIVTPFKLFSLDYLELSYSVQEMVVLCKNRRANVVILCEQNKTL